MAAAGNGSASLDTRGRYKTEAQAVDAVKLLLEAGAKVNARDRSGQTALHGAAGWGWNALVQVLVDSGVELAAKDAQGRTAADIAHGAETSSGRAAALPHPDTEALLRKLMEARSVASVAVAAADADAH
jgi:hypothetical protein